MQDEAETDKEVVTLALDAEMLRRVRKRNHDLPELFERAMRRALAGTSDAMPNPEMRKWREENAEVIKAWNEELEREGLWYEGLGRS